MTEEDNKRADFCREHFTIHGLCKTRIYRIWRKMKERCLKEYCKGYKKYGGRGITICQEWLDDFMSFYDWSMANGYTDELTIDSIDYNGNYEPSNCRWVTQSVQQNNRGNNKKYLYNGEYLTIPQISRLTGVNKCTLWYRLNKYGYDLEKATRKSWRGREI